MRSEHSLPAGALAPGYARQQALLSGMKCWVTFLCFLSLVPEPSCITNSKDRSKSDEPASVYWPARLEQRMAQWWRRVTAGIGEHKVSGPAGPLGASGARGRAGRAGERLHGPREPARRLWALTVAARRPKRPNCDRFISGAPS